MILCFDDNSSLIYFMSILSFLYPMHTGKLNQLKLNKVIEWCFLIGQSNKLNAFDWLKFNLAWIKLV